MAPWTLDRLMGSTHRHPEEEVLGWAKRLRYFYFMGEVSSGQMDLYEELQMRLRFDGRDDLIHVRTVLGLLRYGGESHAANPPDPVSPGHCSIGGTECFVSIGAWFIDVTCFADYHVSTANVEEALRIEAHIDTLLWQARVGPQHRQTYELRLCGELSGSLRP